MRRRLTAAIVGVVAGALAVAGLGSLLITGRAAAADTRREVVQQAGAIATSVEAARRPGVLQLVQRVAHLEGVDILPLLPDGTIVGSPPSGLRSGDIRPQALLSGQTVSSVQGRLAFAAVPVNVAGSALPAARRRQLLERLYPGTTTPGTLPASFLAAVVVTRGVSGVAGGGAYFALTALATLFVAAVVAARLSRRIGRPLSDIESAAERVAAGDLSARVEVAPDDYPELASLGRSINTMTDGLARSRGLERQFLMSVSHDLRTPLTSIRGWAEAIADGAADDDRRAAAVIGNEARRLERLVQDLLDLAKLDARRFSLTVRATHVAEVVADTADSFAPAARDAGLSVSVSVDAPESSLVAAADPDRLAQVVANLVENAYKFAAAAIRVAVGHDGSAVTVAVEDDGPGIAAVDLPHVFDRMRQGVRTPTRQAGSGLGLAIVKELCEAMGADVRAESPTAAGGGTRLVVRLRPWEGPPGTGGAAPPAGRPAADTLARAPASAPTGA